MRRLMFDSGLENNNQKGLEELNLEELKIFCCLNKYVA